MDPERSELLRRIFDEAAERTEADRAEFVRQQCRGDAFMEQEVLSLLEALENQSAPLEADPATWLTGTMREAHGEVRGDFQQNQQHHDDAPSEPASADPLAGTLIGDFRLGQLIGRGAMGVVYRAEQVSLKRPVALKLLQSWTASRDSRRRFIEESTTLARLRHPGIAHVIAAGTRELDLSGPDKSLAAGLFNHLHSVPWIAMELVEGARTIVAYCRERDLPPMAVLRLFAGVCDGVHHGHQQGVIHRDLKPANILVSATGEAKVIDFGVAKAVGTGATRAQDDTLTGGLLGTLRYMSPEQCDGRGRAVDTRTDVYALGVVLYESLTGKMPYEVDESSFASVTRAVCDVPPKDPKALCPSLSADAAMVLLKALRKEPESRYQSAADFAADLRRVLAREPVAARRPSTMYSALMLMRRRPILAAMSAAAIIGVFSGMIGITYGLSRERVARREADRTAWLANLTAADSSIRLGDGGAAMRRLLAIPAERRGWEWKYLSGRADSSVASWDVPGSPDGSVISPTGRWLLAGWLEDGVARVFDVRARALFAEWRLGSCTGLPEWNERESLVAMPMPGVVCVVEMSSGCVVARLALDGPGIPLRCVFSPDDRLLAVGRANPAGLEVFDLASHAVLFRAPSEGWVYRAAFTADGRQLLWCDQSTLERADMSDWSRDTVIAVPRVTKFEPSPVAVSPDGHTAAVICGTFVQLVDLPTRSIRAELRDHNQRVHSIQFDPGGSRLITTSIDRTVRVWDVASGHALSTLLGHEHPTSCATFDPECDAESERVVSVDMASRVRWWDASSLHPVRHADLPHGAEYVRHIVFSEDGARVRAEARLAMSDLDLRDPRAPSVERQFDGPNMCAVPGGDLIIRNTDASTYVLESSTTGRIVWTLKSDPALAIVTNERGSVFAIHQLKDRISVFRVADGAPIGVITSPGSSDHFATFSPDGSRLLVPSYSGEIRLFDAQSCSLIAELAGPGKRGQGAAFSADGSLLAFCHAEGSVTVADARTLKPLVRINDVGGFVWSLALSPDNTRLAVGAQDRITHVFDLPTGDELLQLRDHIGSVMSLAWSADGRYLASGGYDKRVFVYDSKPASGAAR